MRDEMRFLRLLVFMESSSHILKKFLRSRGRFALEFNWFGLTSERVKCASDYDLDWWSRESFLTFSDIFREKLFITEQSLWQLFWVVRFPSHKSFHATKQRICSSGSCGCPRDSSRHRQTLSCCSKLRWRGICRGNECRILLCSSFSVVVQH